MNPNYPLVSERAGGQCEYCHAPDSVFNSALEIDHFVPISVGGTDDPENLVLACRSCNSYKAFHQLGLSRSPPHQPLYNPRVDEWSSHFKLNLETAEIEGLTSIGAGTINRLKFNNFFQLRARRLWMKMQLMADAEE